MKLTMSSKATLHFGVQLEDLRPLHWFTVLGTSHL